MTAASFASLLTLPGADEDIDVLDIRLSCRLLVKSIRGQPLGDRFHTHACGRPRTQRAVPLISGHQRAAAARDNTPGSLEDRGKAPCPQ